MTCLVGIWEGGVVSSLEQSRRGRGNRPAVGPKSQLLAHKLESREGWTPVAAALTAARGSVRHPRMQGIAMHAALRASQSQRGRPFAKGGRSTSASVRVTVMQHPRCGL